MQCKDVLKRISSYALDELDLAERTEVDLHLKECSPCAHQQELAAAAVTHLRNGPMIETSAERREKAREGMRTARQETASRRKRFWLVVRVASISLAASIMISFLGAYYLVAGPHESSVYELVPDRINGRAIIQKDGDHTWQTLPMGSSVREGDWLATDGEGSFSFHLMDQSRKRILGSVVLNTQTRLKLTADHHRGQIYLLLDRGQIHGTLSATDPVHLVIIAPDNDVLHISKGTFEAGLRSMIPSGKSTVSPEPAAESHTIVREWISLEELLQWVQTVTGAEISCPSSALGQSYVSFYSRAMNERTKAIDSKQLLKDLETELERQGLALVRQDGQHLKVLAFIRDPLGGSIRGKLYVRGLSAPAELTGSNGSLRLQPGQEAMVDYWGYPRLSKP